MGEGEGKEGDKKGGKKDEKKGAEAGGEEGEEKDEELEAWLEELQHAAAGTRGADEEVPPQAIEWSFEQFGHDRYAHLYQVLHQRTPEDLAEMQRPRKWRVEIRHVSMTNLSEPLDAFLFFQFGYNFKLKKKFDRKILNRLRSMDKTNEKKYRAQLRALQDEKVYTWAETGTTGIALLTSVRQDVDTNAEAEFDDMFRTTWTGSYIDLYNKKLRLELWDRDKMSVNRFVASAETPLVGIARGHMSVDMRLVAKDPDAPPRSNLKKEFASASFVCVFQEVVTFSIKFARWEATIPLEVFPAPNEEVEPEEAEEGGAASVRVHLPLIRLDMNKRSRMPWHWFALRRSSRLARVVAGEGTPSVNPSFIVVSPMTLTGTRLDVEEATLDVQLLEAGLGMKRTQLAQCAIPLKGVTVSGFIKGQLGYLAGGKVRSGGTVQGQVDVAVPRAPLWKEFVQIGDLSPPELREYPPYNYTYLAVKILRADSLASGDESGLSDPYFSVEWAGQRFTTRVKRATLNPVFNETLYFHVRAFSEHPTQADLLSDPMVTLTCWDYDDTGSSDCLGEGRLYLHQITGPARGEACGCPPRPMQRITIKTKTGPRSKFKDTEVRTRVFRGRLPLVQHIDPVRKSSVQVEAWFRGPLPRNSVVADIIEHDPVRRAKYGELVTVPHFDSVVEDAEARLCVCYGARDESGAKRLCEGTVVRGCCDTFRAVEQELGTRHAGGQWLLEHKAPTKGSHNRFLVALDQSWRERFLPTFLQAIVPPKDLVSPLDIPYMTAEEARYKPNTAYYLLRFVNNMEFCESHEYEGGEGVVNHTIMSPNFFLDMRKGDLRDHAILLCCLLLGLGLDAYLCIGAALQPDPLRPGCTAESEHVWVMTREDHNAACGEDGAEWYTKGGAVKFWEVSTCGTYALPSRWRGADPDTWGGTFRLTRAKKRQEKKRKVVAEMSKEEEEDEEEEAQTARGAALDRLPEEAALQTPAHDEQVQLEEIFQSGAGLGDGWGRASQYLVMQEEARRRDEAESKRRQEEREARARALAALNASSFQHRQQAHIAELNAASPPDPTPYTRLYAVVNHENVFLNAQTRMGDRSTPEWSPALLTYNLETGEADNAWVPVINSRRGAKEAAASFFSTRGLAPKLSEDRVEALEHEITEELEAGITNERVAANIPTRLAPSLRRAIERYMMAKHEFEMLDHNADNGWSFATKDWLPDPTYLGYIRKAALYQARQKLVKTCPPGFKYRFGACLVKYADPLQIRNEVLQRGWGGDRGTKLHLEYHGGREMVAVAAKLFSFYNGVALVRVGLMVVFPDPDAEFVELWVPPELEEEEEEADKKKKKNGAKER